MYYVLDKGLIEKYSGSVPLYIISAHVSFSNLQKLLSCQILKTNTTANVFTRFVYIYSVSWTLLLNFEARERRIWTRIQHGPLLLCDTLHIVPFLQRKDDAFRGTLLIGSALGIGPYLDFTIYPETDIDRLRSCLFREIAVAEVVCPVPRARECAITRGECPALIGYDVRKYQDLVSQACCYTASNSCCKVDCTASICPWTP